MDDHRIDRLATRETADALGVPLKYKQSDSMNIASRTTEGLPSECRVCGKRVSIAPSVPQGDATCPHCGSLLWIANPPDDVSDATRRLAEMGATIETDDEGEIRSVRFIGSHFNDNVIAKLAKLRGIPFIDISQTTITPEGARCLRDALPGSVIKY